MLISPSLPQACPSDISLSASLSPHSSSPPKSLFLYPLLPHAFTHCLAGFFTQHSSAEAECADSGVPGSSGCGCRPSLRPPEAPINWSHVRQSWGLSRASATPQLLLTPPGFSSTSAASGHIHIPHYILNHLLLLVCLRATSKPLMGRICLQALNLTSALYPHLAWCSVPLCGPTFHTEELGVLSQSFA